ncbi:MAG: transglutaminase family protein [Candidatus Eisenbacteria sp.]|nr:transglutaminase family protein [Candidatus Eisenbacteria bacterium]
MEKRVERMPASRGRKKRGAQRGHSDQELRALISLLSDEDRKIVSMVWDNLLHLGEGSLPYLEEVSEHPDPKLRLRARHVASQIRAQVLEKLFRDLASKEGDSFDLEDALCVVARIEHPNLDPRQIARQLQEMADDLKPQMPRVAPPRERIDLLNQFLFRELGFKGNTKDYYDPDNSYINKVLSRRQGIPISLAAVMILVGRRLDLTLHGVGLPKHFVVKYQDPSTEIFVDPFNGGRVFSRNECMQMLTSDGYYFRESFASEYLSISSPRDIVIRMLRNLVLIYSKLKDKTRVRRLSHFVEILRTREKAR